MQQQPNDINTLFDFDFNTTNGESKKTPEKSKKPEKKNTEETLHRKSSEKDMENDPKKLDRKKSEKQMKKEEKEKKKLEEERRKLEEEKKKQEEKEKKKVEKEKRKLEKENRKSRSSLSKKDIDQISKQTNPVEEEQDSSNNNSSNNSRRNSYEKEMEEELSSTEEGPMQWIAKLKKAAKSRLITINNQSNYIIERTKIHEGKGKWRRKPADFVSAKSAIQFGVEGKHATEGYCHFTIENIDEPIEIIWTNNKEGAIASFIIPIQLSNLITISLVQKNTDKFSDICFEIKDKEMESTTTSSSNFNGSTSSLNSFNFDNSKIAETTNNNSSTSILSGMTFDSQSNSTSSLPNGDFSSDEEDEDEKRKTIFKNMQIKSSDQVEEVDSKTLQAAVSAIALTGSSTTGTTSGRRSRRSTLNANRSSLYLNSSDPTTTTTTTTNTTTPIIDNNPLSLSAPSTIQQQQQTNSEKTVIETHDNIDIEEMAKNNMRNTFSELESGNFHEALKNVNQIFQLFGKLDYFILSFIYVYLKPDYLILW